jgi:hypothetical protein
VPGGTTLTAVSGNMNITTAGAVIDARDISGCVTVNAPDVTIKRSRIRSSSCSLVIQNNSTNLLVEDSEIDGLGTFGTAVGSSNLTLRRVNVHGAENGLDVSGNMTVEDSFIHNLSVADATHTDVHTDGIQINEGAADLVFRHNTIRPNPDTVWRSTSCIIMYDDGGVQNTRVRIENNLLDGTGASYAVYAPRQPTTAIYINNNRMRPGAPGGYTAGVQVGVTVTEFNGNVDDATGRVLTSAD